MKKISLFLIGILFFNILSAQENNTIIGGVYDKQSKEPLISASVYYLNSSPCTITNIDGEFLIDRIANPDSIVFSYVGYVTEKYSIDNLPSKIFLDRSFTNLPEIVIIPGYASKIAKKVREKYSKIYNQEKKNKNKESSFFYRQITKSDTIYNEFVECFLTGDHTFALDNLKLQQGRYAKIKLDSLFHLTFTNFFQLSKISPYRPKNASKNEIITCLQPNFDQIYYVEMEDRIYSEEGDILVLNFQPKKEENKAIISGKLYVKETDLAIVRFEGSVYMPMTIHNAKRKESQMGTFTFRINYKEQPDSYPIVETVNCTLSNNISIKNVKHNFQVVSTLFWVEQNSGKSGKKLDSKDKLIEKINKTKYDSEFWKNNPIVKRTKVEENVIKTFENRNAFGTFKSE
ncbi:MAG: carboxypeptidase-like regulatory domain-containing protein [Candidatus Symbiothrix sp.]|jgi:hypothetical protein|nr:carboxypeptidase-like regulatory domain-containing protein [Candidatus Symbiothrix sp.]